MAKKRGQRNWADPEEVHHTPTSYRVLSQKDSTYVEVGGHHFLVRQENGSHTEYEVHWQEYVWIVHLAADGQYEVVDRPEVLDQKPPRDQTIFRAIKKHRAELGIPDRG